MNAYTIGARCFCDFHFGGKPRAVCVAVIEPGHGKGGVNKGQIKVRLTETIGAYRKGEELTLPAWQAVPTKQEIRKRGSFFRWVNTDYTWN